MTTFATKEEFIAGVIDGTAKVMQQVEWNWHDGENFVVGTPVGGRKQIKGLTDDSVLLKNTRGEESHLLLEEAEGETWEFAGHRLTVTIPENVKVTWIINPIF